MKIKEKFEVEFFKDSPPVIKNRADALKLLDIMINAEGVINDSVALKALYKAIKKGIV